MSRMRPLPGGVHPARGAGRQNAPPCADAAKCVSGVGRTVVDRRCGLLAETTSVSILCRLPRKILK